MIQLKDELSALSKKHNEAFESAVYIRMNAEEADEYDESGLRMGKVPRTIGKVRPLVPMKGCASGASA